MCHLLPVDGWTPFERGRFAILRGASRYAIVCLSFCVPAGVMGGDSEFHVKEFGVRGDIVCLVLVPVQRFI